MEKRWCWRCHREVGYLDDDEAAIVQQLMVDQFAVDDDASTPNFFERVRRLQQPAIDAYVDMTGEEPPSHMNHAWHVLYRHRLSLLGPTCLECGKPLRTPRASFCANCGWRPNDDAWRR